MPFNLGVGLAIPLNRFSRSWRLGLAVGVAFGFALRLTDCSRNATEGRKRGGGEQEADRSRASSGLCG